VGRYVKQNAEDWTKVGARVRQVNSTNDSLREQVHAFAKTGQVLPEGYSLRADYQSAGKGRLGRNWEANAGENLLVSYLHRSAGLKPDQLFLLQQSVALAVRNTIEAFTDSKVVKVKWPNDILIGNKKVAGILIESILLGSEVTCVIVGIGINVNQLVFDIGVKATSLRASSGRQFDIREVRKRLSLSLQMAQQTLTEMARIGDFYSLQQRYHHNLFGFGEHLVFKDLSSDEEFTGKLIGVLQSGQLRLQQEGEERRYTLDEIRFVRPNNLIA